MIKPLSTGLAYLVGTPTQDFMKDFVIGTLFFLEEIKVSCNKPIYIDQETSREFLNVDLSLFHV